MSDKKGISITELKGLVRKDTNRVGIEVIKAQAFAVLALIKDHPARVRVRILNQALKVNKL
mgnify:CR=1 FL=1|jgi:hypothetical protein